MKIGFFETEDWEKEYLKSKLKNHSLVFSKDVLNNRNVSSVENVECISKKIKCKNIVKK